MTQAILDKMKRRKAIRSDRQMHKQLNIVMENDCQAAKEKWLNDKCHEIEELQKHFRLIEMHKKVNQFIYKQKKISTGCIRDKNGNILFDEEKVAERWVEYVQDLYNDQREDMPKFMRSTGHRILKAEVESTIRLMKCGKVVGPDDIPIEALMASSEDITDLITNLCNIIYNSGYIPMEMRKSVFLQIPKKPKAQNCTDFRTISLMSHVTKLLLKIIQIRIKYRRDKEISKLQSGFRPGKGTREGLFNIRTVCERAIEMGKDIYICFIDYSKAFDKVRHSKLIECLKEIGLDGKDLHKITKYIGIKQQQFIQNQACQMNLKSGKGYDKVVCYHLDFSTYTLKRYLGRWRI